MIGSSHSIGEYEDEYRNIAMELGIMDDMDAPDIVHKVKFGNGRNKKFRNSTRAKAVAFVKNSTIPNLSLRTESLSRQN